MKLILFIGGGDEALPAVKIAKSMGLKTAVIDLDPNCICFQYCEYKIVCSTYDVDSCVKLSKEFHENTHEISGVRKSYMRPYEKGARAPPFGFLVFYSYCFIISYDFCLAILYFCASYFSIFTLISQRTKIH